MVSGQTAEKIIRDPGFARRLEQACDASPHCPALHRGRLTWIMEQLKKRFDEKVSAETVRRWTSGEAKPRQDKNTKLAQILGVDAVWLYLGVDPDLTPRERKVRNAMADGAVNLIAGLIQMDGGYPAFPEESDSRAQREHVDLYAVIKGANYSFHVALGEKKDAAWSFKVPVDHEHIVVLGVVREGFAFRVVEISAELIEQHSTPGGGRSNIVTLDDDVIEAEKLENFAHRL